MTVDEKQLLRAVPVFQNLSEATLDRIAVPGIIQSFDARAVLLSENTWPESLFFILDGQVMMTARSHDGVTILEVLRPHDCFILAAVLNNEVCLQSATALTEVRIAVIPAVLVRELMVEDMDFMRAIVYEQARAYRRIVKELKTQKLRNSVERLANWVLKESAANGDADQITIPFEKRVLAAYLGMTPENLSRSFSSLTMHGVKVRGSIIEIVDRNRLIRFAAPSNLIDSVEAPLA